MVVLLGFGRCLVYIIFDLFGAALAAIAFKVACPASSRDWQRSA